jgi:hypothetical protein
MFYEHLDKKRTFGQKKTFESLWLIDAMQPVLPGTLQIPVFCPSLFFIMTFRLFWHAVLPLACLQGAHCSFLKSQMAITGASYQYCDDSAAALLMGGEDAGNVDLVVTGTVVCARAQGD